METSIWKKVRNSLVRTIEERSKSEMQRKLQAYGGITRKKLLRMKLEADVNDEHRFAVDVLASPLSFGALVELVIKGWHIVYCPLGEDEERYAAFKTDLGMPYSFYTDGDPENAVNQAQVDVFENVFYGSLDEIINHLELSDIPQGDGAEDPGWSVVTSLQVYRRQEPLL